MKSKKFLLFIMCMVLVAAMALGLSGCNKKNDDGYDTVTVSDGAVLGEGAKQFDVAITDKDGKVVNAVVKTDKDTVGAALVDVKLIDGDDGEYGLYVKEVNGVIADYDKDGYYWAFYIDNEYAATGVDSTEIKEGAKYALKIEK